jgi:CubicO group peptidase (beta-lactamase class C family)
MRRRFTWTFAIYALTLAGPARAEDPATKAVGEKPGPTPESLGAEDLAGLLEPIRFEHEIPALAAAVVRGDKLIAIGAVGVRRAGGAERVGIADRFHIGSCTKSMTATLCAMLVEEGKLRWDTTIGEALDELVGEVEATYHYAPGDSAWRGVTLEQLLCHRGGLPDDRTPDATFREVRAWGGDIRQQRRQFLKRVLAEMPASSPGAAFEYANAGFVIAGGMAEAAADQSWEDLMRTRLFEPLAITTGGFGPPGAGRAVDQPWEHTVMGRLAAIRPSRFADNPPVYGPAGTVHLSLIDWAKYASLHLEAARSQVQRLAFIKLHSDPYEQGYGFGWGIAERPWAGGKVLMHAGSNTMWFSQIVLAPGRDLGLLVAANRADEPAQKGVGKTLEALIDRFAAPPPVDSTTPQAESGATGDSGDTDPREP